MFDRKLIYQTALMSLQWSSSLKALIQNAEQP